MGSIRGGIRGRPPPPRGVRGGGAEEARGEAAAPGTACIREHLQGQAGLRGGSEHSERGCGPRHTACVRKHLQGEAITASALLHFFQAIPQRPVCWRAHAMHDGERGLVLHAHRVVNLLALVRATIFE